MKAYTEEEIMLAIERAKENNVIDDGEAFQIAQEIRKAKPIIFQCGFVHCKATRALHRGCRGTVDIMRANHMKCEDGQWMDKDILPGTCLDDCAILFGGKENELFEQ